MSLGPKQNSVVDFTLIGVLLAVALLIVGPSSESSWAQGKGKGGGKGAAGKKTASTTANPAVEDMNEGVEQVDLGTRDILERLKLLRVQMALDREEISALDLRIEKIKKEREFENVLNAGSSTASAKPRRDNPLNDIIVKSVTLEPRKEAVIMYRGRVFMVRPGDKIGGFEIRNITESGLEVKSGKSGTSTVR
jgi:hypothetical protein